MALLSNVVRASAVGAALLWATGAGAATLLGTSVSASITSNVPFVTVTPGSNTVGAGTEFAIDLGAFIDVPRGILVDVGATTITLTYSGEINTVLNGANAVFSLTNLSFGAGIAGISVVETPPTTPFASSGFGGNLVTFDATSVFVTLRGIWDGNGSVTISLVEREGEEPPVVPLPASAVLLLAGIGGLAAMRRRAV